MNISGLLYEKIGKFTDILFRVVCSSVRKDCIEFDFQVYSRVTTRASYNILVCNSHSYPVTVITHSHPKVISAFLNCNE